MLFSLADQAFYRKRIHGLLEEMRHKACVLS